MSEKDEFVAFVSCGGVGVTPLPLDPLPLPVSSMDLTAGAGVVETAQAPPTSKQ